MIATSEDVRSRIALQPRVPLVLAPTPLHELPRLAQKLGIGRLLAKRDDLTGLALGGNKVRSLEFRLAEARQLLADVVIAGLEAQSNSARQTAAAANLLGMRSILVLRRGQECQWQGNLLIDRILGAQVRWLEDFNGMPMEEATEEVAEEQRRLGHRPYVMNSGRAFVLGSGLGYLLCAVEIIEQASRLSLNPSHLYMSSANKGHSGLVAARALFGRTFRAVAISHRPSPDRVSGALAGARLVLDTLGYNVPVDVSDVESDDRYIGDGYGIPSNDALEAIRLAAETEGLILDPIYTGKAMAGLMDHARRGRIGKNDTVVFIHTGGQPALFAWKDRIITFLSDQGSRN